MTAFIAGATGYTGHELVRLLCEEGHDVVAHIRPESSKREGFTKSFEALGATVDCTPWEKSAIEKTIGDLSPDVVFSALGTTRARKKEAADKELETYHAVDYGLTVMLAAACALLETPPRFVYVSAVGVSAGSLSEYMRARWEAENFIEHAGLPYTIVRPSFISGPDRDEFRLGERVGAVATDALLAAAGVIGFVGLRDQYSSMTAAELAHAMVRAAYDPEYENRILEPKTLRKLAP